MSSYELPDSSPLSHLARPGPVRDKSHDISARYDAAVGWPNVPDGIDLVGNTASVAVAPDDTVWVFHRGPVPVLQFDEAGNLLRAWGEGEFERPHGITIDGAGDVYLVDEFGHYVQKRTPDGAVLMEIGTRGVPAEWQQGGTFNRPTAVAVHQRTGDLFVSDGYGNSRVHRFDREGNHLLSWGRPGSSLGCFSLPHHVSLVADDLVVVSDRENFRLQFFDRDGRVVGLWHSHRPCAAVPMGFRGEQWLLVAELGASGVQREVADLGTRIVALDSSGRERLSFDHHGELPAGRLVAPHDVAVDSRGRIYVAEVASAWLNYNFDIRPETEPCSLRRWEPAELTRT